ncbi:hypothetical protein PRNP1_015201 [Phytophthora ramorum]
MATSTDSSGHTTRARSVETVDGYVSRGRAPPTSVPRDHAILQDFTAYLELRLKSQNLSMLRRIFADFLNEHENTLVPMMRQGCTIVTIFPVLRTSARRRQEAEFLLAKPKWPLDSRGCVFLYLQYRTATRNMALLKHMFLQFVCQRETALMDFVQRGCQVISVIPFELPQLVPPVCQAPPPVQQVASDTAVVKKVKKRRTERASVQRASPRVASPAVAQVEDVHKKKKRKLRRVSEIGEVTAAVADDSAQQEDVVAPRDPGGGVASAQAEEMQLPRKKKKGESRRVSGTGEATAATADDSAQRPDAVALSEPEGAAVSVQVGKVQMAQKKGKRRPHRAVKTRETTAAIAAQQRDVAAPDVAASVQVGDLRPRRAVKIGETTATIAHDSALLQDVAAPSEPEGAAASVQIGEVQMADEKVKGRFRRATTIRETTAADDSTHQQDVITPDVQVGEVPVAQKKARGRPRHAVKTGETAPATADDSALLQDVAAPSEPEGVAVAVQVGEVPVAQKKARGRPRHAVKTGETAPATADDSALLQDVAAPSEPEGVAVAVQVGEVPVAQKKARGRPRHAVKTGETAPATADDSALLQDVAAPSEPEGVAVAVQVGEVPVAQKKARGRPRHAVKTGETAPATADDSALLQDVAAPSEPEGVAVAVQVDEVPVAQKKIREIPDPAVKTGDKLAAIADDLARVGSREPDGDSAPVQQKDSAAIEGPEEDAVAIEGPDDDASLSRQEDAAATGEPEIVTKRRRKHITPVAVSAPGVNEEAKTEVASCSSSAAVPTQKRGRKPKARAASDESEVTGAATTAKPADGSLAESLEPPKAKRGRKRKVDNAVPINEKSRKRGKPAMSDAMCRSQLELTQKMEPFEAQVPWEAVYSNLPAPFDEPKHPELSRKFRKFWRAHGRAVWERNFWPPMSRKLSLLLFNKRNNRQLTAKNAFESIIISAYKELGAEFFVMLDTHKPRHPGWWYRGPVVALFALQQIKGENAVWDYVQKEALERFPDCRLALPLKAPNSGAVSKCHKRDSESMWMANHQLTPEILLAIAALKAGQQTCGEAEATEGDLMTAVDYLALL